MSKFYGVVGYSIMRETAPGVIQEIIEERPYYGDVIRISKKWEAGSNLNDNLNIMNEISIIADPFAYRNFHTIRYASYMGAKWKVRDVTVAQPRLILTIGGVYNEQQIGIPEETGSN